MKILIKEEGKGKEEGGRRKEEGGKEEREGKGKWATPFAPLESMTHRVVIY